MILDFYFKLGDHEVIVQVDELPNGKFYVAVRELDFDNSAIVNIDCTFVSRCSAERFAKRYVEDYMSEM